jgi:tetratricopeptide (TPR) repeat protein
MAAGADGATSAPVAGAAGGLTPELHRILAYASAIGPEFSFSLLAASMGADEEPLAEQLERLVQDDLLRERPGGERFRFAAEEARAAIYRSLTESRLRILHRRIAEAMERIDPPASLDGLAELGRHYFLGRVAAKSYEYNRRAADQARLAEEPERAIDLYERALLNLAALPGDRRAERAEIAERLADLSYATSHYAVADRWYEEAMRNVGREEPRVRGRLELARAEVARENLDLPTAARGATEALRLFGSSGDPLGSAEAYRLLGRLAFQRGEYREALEESLKALEELLPGGDPKSLGRLSIDIANAFALLGEEVRPVAIEWYERAIQRLRSSSDWAELARALHNLGVTLGESRPMDGLEHLERARAAAERAHDVRAAGRSVLSGVEIRLALGQVEEAERDNQEAGLLLGRLNDALGAEQVEANRGRIAERRGHWDDAERAYVRASDLARAAHLRSDEGVAEFCLARLRFKTRNLPGAREAFRRATELKVTELSPRLASAYEELRATLELVDEEAAPASGSRSGLSGDVPSDDDTSGR